MSNTNLYDKWNETLAGKEITTKKYFHEGEDFEDFVLRVGNIFSTPELQDDIVLAIEDANFFPAGRSLFGAGSKGKFKASMSNCYILPSSGDNIESIFDRAKEQARIYSYGGGCGINISNLRPNEAIVNNSALTSSGSVSFMDLYNTVGKIIGASNKKKGETSARRAALMIGLDCTHPDLEEFLEIKKNNTELQSANISILYNDDFMKAVENNEEYTLSFKTKHEFITKVINARDFFMKVAGSNWDFAEPGAIFIDKVKDYNLLSGYPKDIYNIDICNPCVSGDTLILTRDGYIPIVDLVGKEVELWNGYEWSIATPKITGHNQSMKLIKFSNGMEIKCTDYHKFVLKNGTKVEAINLKIGDKLQKWEYPILSGFTNLPNAYTRGFYSGDGTKGYNQICLYGDKTSLLSHLDYISYNDEIEKQKRFKVKISGDNYSKTFVPQNNYSIKSRLEWLAGFIDSDGCLNDVGGSVAVSSIDRDFLLRLQLMLSTLGCPSSINVMHKECYKEMPLNNGKNETKEYFCQECYRLSISSFNVSNLVKLGLVTYRVPLQANPNRDAGRYICVKEIIDIPNEDTVYCFNEPKNHTGVFNGIMTGQCGEFYGNAYNSCNLGSINLYNIVNNPFTKESGINYAELTRLARLGITALDEILDYGYDMQPLDENRKCIDDWRSIGLGVFGLADMFIALGVKYGSPESIEIIRSIMSCILKNAIDQSIDLAKEKGSFGKYDYDYVIKSPIIQKFPELHEKLKKYGLRNGSLLSIAPNGSIATMCGMSGGVEPLFAVSYQRTTHALEKEGKFFKVFAKSVEHLLRYNGVDPESITDEEIIKRFPFVVTSHNIDPFDRIKLQATMQEYVDNAISSTINLKQEATVEDVFNIYIEAWKAGCKGVTVFRNGCARTSIMRTGKEKNETSEEILFDSIDPMKSSEIGDDVDGTKSTKHTACVKNMYNHVYAKDGNIVEVFTNTSQKGGCTSNINTITRLASLALRSGVKVSEVISEMEATSCGACIKLKEQGRKDISNSCGHAIAEAIEKAYLKYNNEEEKDDSGMLICPQCGKKTLKPEGKCFSCINCLYSRCE